MARGWGDREDELGDIEGVVLTPHSPLYVERDHLGVTSDSPVIDARCLTSQSPAFLKFKMKSA